MKLILVFAVLAGVLALSLQGARSVQGAASSVSMTQSCFAGAIEGRFRWMGNDVTAKEQWLDLSTFDNHWAEGTFQSQGPFMGRINSYSWLGLDANTVYYFRVNQQLKDGAWDASGTFQATTTTCPDSGGIRLSLDTLFGGSAAKSMQALATELGPTTPAPGRVVGFSTKPPKELAELTPPGGTISGCSDGLIYAVVHVPTAAGPAAYGPFPRPNVEWTRDGKKSQFGTLGTFGTSTSGILTFFNFAVAYGGVYRFSTFTFDIDTTLRVKSASGVYAVSYGTGPNAVEGSVTLNC